MEDEYLKNFKDGVADALVRGVSNLEADWGKGYKKGYDFGMTVFSEQMEQEEPHEKVDILADKDQQAEDDYWDNHPEEAKKPPLDENLEKVILGAFKKVFPERFTPTDNSDVEVVSENVMWVGFKDYDIRIEKDPEYNEGHLQISVHSKEDDGYMLHQDGEPCKLIVREENENE